MAYGTREVQCRIYKGSSIIPILRRINPVPRIDTYFFKIQSNIVIHLDLPNGLIPVGLKKLTSWLMEPGGLMPHSQGLSNNPYPEANQPNYPHSYLSL